MQKKTRLCCSCPLDVKQTAPQIKCTFTFLLSFSPRDSSLIWQWFSSMTSLSSKVSPLFFLQMITALSKRNAYLMKYSHRVKPPCRRSESCRRDDHAEHTPVLFGLFLRAADLQLSVDLGPTKKSQRLSLRSGKMLIYSRKAKNNQRDQINKKNGRKQVSSPSFLWTSESW